MTKRNTFNRLTGSTYLCDTCGRRTRNTGHQGIGCRLCPQCFDLAGIENEISDGYCTLEERTAEIAELAAEIRSKGGNPDANFKDILS